MFYYYRQRSSYIFFIPTSTKKKIVYFKLKLKRTSARHSTIVEEKPVTQKRTHNSNAAMRLSTTTGFRQRGDRRYHIDMRYDKQDGVRAVWRCGGHVVIGERTHILKCVHT